MRIKRECIDRIIQSADIVEIVSDFVTLKKSGSNFSALSPFTNERTPSFFVSPSKQIFKCFSTQKGGDSIKFLMEIDGLTYVEALKYIAKKYSIDIEYENTANDSLEKDAQSDRDALYILLSFANTYFQQQLLHTETGNQIGLAYFKERGLDEQVIKEFELGYSQDSWDGLLREATKNQYNLELLEKAGLIKTNEQGKKFDFFRNRVIFPIHNVTGKVIAFTGRILTSDKNVPKYINSPETELYHKSEVLYGLYQAKKYIRSENNCYLVEGNMDVLSLHQGGIKNTVASSGTALTQEQINHIARLTKNVTVLYDSDRAGIKAAIRGTDMLLESGLNIKVVLFPEGQDPDSYINQVGATAFKNYIQKYATDFISFKTEHLLIEIDQDPIKKTEIIKEIVQSISKVRDAISRALYFKKCSQLLQIDEQVLLQEYNRLQLLQRKKNEPQAAELIANEIKTIDEQHATNSQLVDRVTYAEREIIRILIEYSQVTLDSETPLYDTLLKYIEHVEFQNKTYEKIINLFKSEIAAGKVPGIDYFLSYPDAELEKEIMHILADPYSVSENWLQKAQVLVPQKDENKSALLYKTIASLNFEKTKHHFKVNMEQLKNIEDSDTLETELEKLKIIKQYMMEYAREMGLVVSA